MSGQPPWPETEQPLLDFFEVRKGEGAPRTAYASLLSSLRFLEEAGEIPEAERVSRGPALSNAEKELALAAAQRPKEKEPRGQAPQLPLAVVVALEGFVNDEARPGYQRAFAGFRLLRHWASLRWDDTQGLPPHSFERRARGLEARLDRTKASGKGKQVEVLPCFVSSGAWISQEWLDTTHKLLTSGSFGFARDFLLPLPTWRTPEAGGCDQAAKLAHTVLS